MKGDLKCEDLGHVLMAPKKKKKNPVKAIVDNRKKKKKMVDSLKFLRGERRGPRTF